MSAVTDLPTGTRVRVHVNLHKGTLAVADPATGKVIGYANNVTLTGVTFRTQAACLDRVAATGVRKVCAYAVGTLQAVDAADVDRSRDVVTFNPHRSRDFTLQGAPVTSADVVTFADLRCYVVGAQ